MALNASIRILTTSNELPYVLFRIEVNADANPFDYQTWQKNVENCFDALWYELFGFNDSSGITDVANEYGNKVLNKIIEYR
jgi:AAA+ superfamily predicted ATPase